MFYTAKTSKQFPAERLTFTPIKTLTIKGYSIMPSGHWEMTMMDELWRVIFVSIVRCQWWFGVVHLPPARYTFTGQRRWRIEANDALPQIGAAETTAILHAEPAGIRYGRNVFLNSATELLLLVSFWRRNRYRSLWQTTKDVSWLTWADWCN